MPDNHEISGNGTSLSGSGSGIGDFRHTPAGFRIAPMSMAEHFPGGMPVLEIAALGSALLDPQQVGGVLDFRLGEICL